MIRFPVVAATAADAVVAFAGANPGRPVTAGESIVTVGLTV